MYSDLLSWFSLEPQSYVLQLKKLIHFHTLYPEMHSLPWIITSSGYIQIMPVENANWQLGIFILTYMQQTSLNL